jgi:hypothetical protein
MLLLPDIVTGLGQRLVHPRMAGSIRSAKLGLIEADDIIETELMI